MFVDVDRDYWFTGKILLRQILLLSLLMLPVDAEILPCLEILGLLAFRAKMNLFSCIIEVVLDLSNNSCTKLGMRCSQAESS